MLIDATQFPLVWTRLSASSADPDVSPFASFEALLARKERFVLINDEGLDKETNDHSHTPAQAKQLTLWMKRNKAELRAYVRAGIYIEPSGAKRLAAKAFAVVYEKFWGYPMLIVATKDQALALAHKLLCAEPDDGNATGIG